MRKDLITLGLVIVLTLLLYVFNANTLIIILAYALVALFRNTIVKFLDDKLP